MGRVAILILVVMGLFLIANLCFIVYVLVRTPKLNKPLTSDETLKAAPHFSSNAIRHPRLTSPGKWIVVIAVAFVTLLHRTYKFVLTGHFATGIVVAAKIGSITSWGLFYDFMDGSGKVVRGSSSRRFYTVALARCFHGAEIGNYFAVGSYVPVLFRADDSSRNALYVSFPWAI